MNTQVQDRNTALADRIEDKIDRDFARGIAINATNGGGGSFMPATLAEAMEFAKMMAISGPMVGIGFRTKPGTCLGIAMQAWRWEMDPFPVSQKAYVTKNKAGDEVIAYEAQLVAAVINSRANLESSPEYVYVGEGQEMKCIVTAKKRGDTPKSVETPMIKDIKIKNSPLWFSDPQQQLGYYAIRNWGRRHAPEILLGVYDVDEMDEVQRSERARDVTPKAAPSAPAAPRRQDFAPKSEVIDVAAGESDLAKVIAEIEQALGEAGTADELSNVWAVAGRDGDLDAIRRGDPQASARLSTIYNTRHVAFDEARIEAEEKSESGAEVINEGPQETPADSKIAEADAAEAEATTKACIKAVQHFKTVSQLNAWFDGDFMTTARDEHLSDEQIARVKAAVEAQLKSFE